MAPDHEDRVRADQYLGPFDQWVSRFVEAAELQVRELCQATGVPSPTEATFPVAFER